MLLAINQNKGDAFQRNQLYSLKEAMEKLEIPKNKYGIRMKKNKDSDKDWFWKSNDPTVLLKIEL